MNLIKLILRIAGYLLRTITFGWLVDVADLLKRVWAALKALHARRKLPHPDREISVRCVSTDHPSVHRPDPCIYSQSYLLLQGFPVTWDNPDIVIRRGGIVVPEGELLPNTLHEVEATIWNNSFDAPVVAMRVDFSFLSFGVGTTSTPIGSGFVDVGVKASLRHPGRVTVPWTTPAIPGHYCIQVAFTWIDDANPNNNLGQNNVNVALAASPAQFAFQLRNAFTKPRRYTFTVDTYRLPELDPCSEAPRPEETGAERIRRIAVLHRLGDIEIPPAWVVKISPEEVDLAPGDEVTVQVAVTPPAAFAGDQPLNITAFADGAFAGGVTLVARKS
ncbi:MAG: NEW3 domain-containing protein [Gemmatimonadota bacterium]|nr:NEW3 domain-containing protein [Gemmatimonadota bacterium]